MQDDEFEWDDRKATINVARHGVSFESARRVFDDPFAFELSDDRMNYGEERMATIGMVDERLISVSWTPRDERVRVISARFATAQEGRLYHDDAF